MRSFINEEDLRGLTKNGCFGRVVTYKIILKEIDMSGENLYEDLALLNKEIETSIREQPERYLWIHRRFKHRPKNDLEIYDRSLMRKKR